VRRLSLLIACWLIAYPVAGQTYIDAQYQHAFKLRTQGSDAEALEILQEIEKEAPSERSKAQIAIAEQALGLWVEAERDLLLAFARNDPWVGARREKLQAALVTIQRHLGTLELGLEANAPRGLEVLADGKRIEASAEGRFFRLRTGRHEIEVRADGYFTVVREVSILPDAAAREPIRLLARATNPGPTKSVTNSPSLRVVLAWISLGVGIGSGALSVSSGVLSNGFAHSYNDDPLCGRPTNKPQTCLDDQSRVRNWRTLAALSGVASVALAATGVTLLLTQKTSVSVSPQGLVFYGAF
jgi:hypothetical protein